MSPPKSLKDWLIEATPVLKWTSLLDSRPPAPTGSLDEGAFTVLSETDVLETGKLYNPVAGKDEEYEEVWRRHRVPEGSVWCVLERVNGAYATEANGGASEEERAFRLPRAFLARFGPYALGLARTPGGFAAYRDHLEHEGWVRKYSFSAESLPALPAEQPKWRAGEVVRLGDGGGEWLVLTAGRT